MLITYPHVHNLSVWVPLAAPPRVPVAIVGKAQAEPVLAAAPTRAYYLSAGSPSPRRPRVLITYPHVHNLSVWVPLAAPPRVPVAIVGKAQAEPVLAAAPTRAYYLSAGSPSPRRPRVPITYPCGSPSPRPPACRWQSLGKPKPNPSSPRPPRADDNRKRRAPVGREENAARAESQRILERVAARVHPHGHAH